jgi:hypothetical protein
VLFRIICYSLIFLVWLVFAVAIPFVMKYGLLGLAIALFFELISVFLSFRLILGIVDLIFFKEVRLYRDRMVKIWKFIGDRQIGLAQASLGSASQGIRARTLCE